MRVANSSRRLDQPAGGSLWPALCGLALLAFALRMFHLDFQSLWRDEVDAVLFATRDLRSILATFSSAGDNGPLYFLSLHAWIKVAGQTEFAIRFPSACFGVLAVLATYQLGRATAGWRVGLIAALLMAISPYHIWYSQEAKMYALVSFLAPLSLVVLLRAIAVGRIWLWLAWLAIMAAFLYVHLFALLIALVALAWMAILLSGRRRMLLVLTGLLLAGGIVALPVLRWLVPAALTPAETGYGHFGLGQMVDIVVRNFSMGLRPAAGLWPVAVFAALLVLGAVPLLHKAAWRGWPPARGTLLLLIYLTLPLGAVWLVSLWRPVFTDRYLILSLPAFYLVIAGGIVVVAAGAVEAWLSPRSRSSPEAQGDRQARRIAATRAGMAVAQAGDAPQSAPGRAGSRLAWRSAAVAGTALLVVIAAPFIWGQAHNPYKADFRAAARYLAGNAAPSEPVMFLMPYAQRGFAYYHPAAVQTLDPPYTNGMPAAQVDEAMKKLTAGRSRIWLFMSEAEFWDPQGLITAWLDAHGAQNCRQVFAYIEVRCYDLAR